MLIPRRAKDDMSTVESAIEMPPFAGAGQLDARIRARRQPGESERIGSTEEKY
jgi:hypothetical protein